MPNSRKKKVDKVRIDGIRIECFGYLTALWNVNGFENLVAKIKLEIL